MSARLLLDALERPDLFDWNGAIEEPALRSWLAAHDLHLPNDLIRFLAATGGGDLFESETILGPHGNAELSDDIHGANAILHGRGLPRDLVAFHRGMCLSAVERASGAYLTLVEPGWSALSRFPSLDSWYVGTLRFEYADRYGLSRAAG